jgi:hypothetical protein
MRPLFLSTTTLDNEVTYNQYLWDIADMCGILNGNSITKPLQMQHNEQEKSTTWVEKIENELRSEMKRNLKDFLEIKDFSPGKWEEDETTEDKPLSFGQKAVAHADSGWNGLVKEDLDIHRIKSSIAELIDIVDLRVPQARAVTEDGFLQRMAKDDATKKLIDACDAAVKYVTMSK